MLPTSTLRSLGTLLLKATGSSRAPRRAAVTKGGPGLHLSDEKGRPVWSAPCQAAGHADKVARSFGPRRGVDIASLGWPEVGQVRAGAVRQTGGITT